MIHPITIYQPSQERVYTKVQQHRGELQHNGAVTLHHEATQSAVMICLFIVFALTFSAFTIYALCTQSASSITEKCGDSLWKYVLSSLVLCIFFVYFYFTIEYTRRRPLIGWIFWTAVLIYNLSMVIIGAKITNDAMTNADCTTALANSSFTNTPLLGITGLFFIFLNATWIIKSIFDAIGIYKLIG
jgi:hypothetical protein